MSIKIFRKNKSIICKMYTFTYNIFNVKLNMYMYTFNIKLKHNVYSMRR